MPISKAAAKKLRVLPLAAVIFLTVSGGPYGLEPLIGYAGKNAALLILLITPLLWDIPTIFTVLELNSMMPVTGGYYQWVKKAMGLRWAFYEGWWSWLYTFADLAIYPVMFVQYASFFFPELQLYKIPVCLVMIWGSAYINIRGIVPVGQTSLILGAMVLTPFIILFVCTLSQYHTPIVIPAVSFKGLGFSSFGMALYTIMWNMIGWDSTTTYAEEVDKPIKTYLSAVAIAFAVVMVVYFLASLTALHSGIDPKILKDQGFPILGELIAGRWLGVLLAIGGMASAMGIYSAVLLSGSRIPQVMAADHLLPAKLHQLHPKLGTPYISIIVSSVIVSFMVLFTFADLVVIDITLYGAGLILEFIALIVMRVKFPDMHRPFKIPLNVAGLCLMILLPSGVYTIALCGILSQPESNLWPPVFAILLLLTAELLWWGIKWRRGWMNES